MILKPYENWTPKLHPTVRVAENASIIGNVTLKQDVNVWYNAVIRGDGDAITVGEGTNIQDGVVIHCDKGSPVTVGKGAVIGHNAIVHSCTVGDNCMIGMGACLLSGCKIGAGSVVGAGAVVPGNLDVPPRSLVLGLPAKVVKEVTQEQLEYTAEDVTLYIQTAKKQFAAVGEE